jgi:hypothetical protein
METTSRTNVTSDNDQLQKQIIIVLSVLCAIGIFIFSFLRSDALKDISFSFYTFQGLPGDLTGKDSIQLAGQFAETQKRITDLRTRIERLTPAEPYLIVNTTANTFVLRTRKKIIREGICSSGSYTLLVAGENRQWIFKTPRGQFRVLGKIADPLWIKPDWAYIEEGLPVPSINHPDRYEYGTLGDYALNLGQGYLIHGTLYQRFLGLPVTHGCIRLGDEDIKSVYKNLKVGSRVYIF